MLRADPVTVDTQALDDAEHLLPPAAVPDGAAAAAATDDTAILLLTEQTVHEVADFALDQDTLTLPDTGNMDPSQTFPPVLADSGPAAHLRISPVVAEAPQGLSVIRSSAAAQSSPVAHRGGASAGVPTEGLNRLRLPDSNGGGSMNRVGEGLREHPLDGIDRMGTSTSSATTGSTRSTTSSTVGESDISTPSRAGGADGSVSADESKRVRRALLAEITASSSAQFLWKSELVTD